MKTVDDLIPGKVFRVCNQGMNIRPETVDVEIYWVGPNAVHYIVHGNYGYSDVRETSIDRFLDILNQGKQRYEEDE